eukprot:3529691-Rhodomonas_salina.1
MAQEGRSEKVRERRAHDLHRETRKGVGARNEPSVLEMNQSHVQCSPEFNRSKSVNHGLRVRNFGRAIILIGEEGRALSATSAMGPIAAGSGTGMQRRRRKKST